MAKIPLKIVSIGLTLVGAVLTLTTNWVEDKKLDEKVEKKVNEAIAKEKNKEES